MRKRAYHLDGIHVFYKNILFSFLYLTGQKVHPCKYKFANTIYYTVQVKKKLTAAEINTLQSQKKKKKRKKGVKG
jgi:hypothetical protein